MTLSLFCTVGLQWAFKCHKPTLERFIARSSYQG